jgi:PAS domain S-box-containing protein
VEEPGDPLNEAWPRAVWAAATDAIALSDAKGRVPAANPAYHRLYGYTPAEVLGQSFAVIFPPAERASAEAVAHQLPRGTEVAAGEPGENVEIGAARARPGVLLMVRDGGIGIRADDLPHVFERFRRGENVRGTAGGSGLGLFNVQQIVQRHGVRCPSPAVKEGTTVSVWLPLRPYGPGDDRNR